MRIDPVPPTYRLVDRRNTANERRAAPRQEDNAANDRRQHARLTTGVLAAPFGAHLLGQVEPCAKSPAAALNAYRKAANA